MFFNFTPSQRKGTIILIIVLSAILFIIHFTTIEVEIKNIETIPILSKTYKSEYKKKIKKKDSLFIFDPNTATKTELERLGLSHFQSNQIANFRNSGGNFYKKEDLKKIYSINTQDYLKLEPFIKINNKNSNKHKNIKSYNYNSNNSQNKKIKNKIKIELNSADSTSLCQLPYIGAKRANKIINLRTQLKGFYNINQIKEILDADSSYIDTIKALVTINTNFIRKISVNTATYSQLKELKFLDSYDVRNILNYKKIVIHINSIKELKENDVISQDTYQKVKFYLTP